MSDIVDICKILMCYKIVPDVAKYINDTKIEMKKIIIDESKFEFKPNMLMFNYIDKPYAYITIKDFVMVMRTDTSYINISHMCRRNGKELSKWITDRKINDIKSKTNIIHTLTDILKLPVDKLMYNDYEDVYAISSIAKDVAKWISQECYDYVNTALIIIVTI